MISLGRPLLRNSLRRPVDVNLFVNVIDGDPLCTTRTALHSFGSNSCCSHRRHRLTPSRFQTFLT
jgi:hypothetical protein